MFGRIASFSYARPRLILAIAAVVALLLGAYGFNASDRLFAAAYDPDSSTESAQVADQLTSALGYDPGALVLVMVEANQPVSDPEVLTEIGRLQSEIESDPNVGSVDSILQPGNSKLLTGRSGRAAMLLVHLERPEDDEATITTSRRLEGLDSKVVDVRLGGYGPATVEFTDKARDDLLRAELLTLPILLLLLLLVFRGVVAALLPFAIGIFSSLGTFAMIKLVDQLTPISVFSLNVATALGLGLAIDYSLLMVSRYREELEVHGEGLDALRITVERAGRPVLYSGLTIAAAMATLMIFPQRLIYSMGVGGLLVALFAVAAALLILPAALALLGPRVNALSVRRKPPPVGSGGWFRLSRFVMRRPGTVAAASAVLLIAMGIPFLSAKFSGVYAGFLPDSSPVKQTELERVREFPQFGRSTVEVVVTDLAEGAQRSRDLDAVISRIERVRNVEGVGPVLPIGEDVVLLQVISKRSPSNDASSRLVRRLRSLDLPASIEVGGEAARFLDFKSSVAKRVPLAFALIAVTMFVLIFLMTGSVVLPIKMLIMNVLSLSATFGILVVIFQQGHLEGLLDYRSAGGVDIAIAPLVLAAGFGLATDYGLFLIARIREAHLRGDSDADAISFGMQKTGRLITSAALLLCVALGALVTSSVVFIKEAGLGLALAVAIDATIVRALLVPSLMRLMGRWNWWAPKPLVRLHEKLGLSDV